MPVLNVDFYYDSNHSTNSIPKIVVYYQNGCGIATLGTHQIIGCGYERNVYPE
jgi:hypothetical protein